MKKIIRVTLLSLKNRIKSVDTIIIIIFLLSYFSFVFPVSSGNVVKANEAVNIFAPFIHGFMIRDFKILALLGLIMLLGAQNVAGSHKVNILMRVDEKEWYASELFTMIFTCVFYSILLFLLCALFYFPVLTISPGWGSGVESYRFFTNILTLREELLQENVFLMFGEAFILVTLVGILFGSICLLSDTLGNKRMGPMACGALIVWNLVVQGTAGTIPEILSPVAMVTGYATGNFGYSAVYLLLLDLLVINAFWIAGQKSDAI